ncbi:MAG: HAMP domain-containing histidine kinase [Roseburia sp.]|nr:HAMP domain-containing histidine kinase [Roseburia sp.]MCM1243238.1 HAMP domain-containing histidine kinase [Roseburia sp.]
MTELWIAAVFILCCVLLFLILRFCRVKRQLREITAQLQRRLERQEEAALSIELGDRDVERMTALVNEIFERLLHTQAEAGKSEAALRASIALISHDMRTPLTSVIGYLQLAGKNCKEADTLKNIRIAEERAIYCNRLVNDFFELSIVDSGEYEPQMSKLDIGEILCEQILANYPNFEQKKITPEFEQAGRTFYINGDAGLLERALQNLIANSIKYSSGRILFSLSEQPQMSKVILQVSNAVNRTIDTERVFDRFYREESFRGADGTGLGLYICRKFVEDMGGSIRAVCEGGIFMVEVVFVAAGLVDDG